MAAITLSRPDSCSKWLRIYRLYLSAFPASERKPFSVIVNMYRKGSTDVWCIQTDGRFAGFAATINEENLILLDYLAVERRHRGEGIGSAALLQLKEIYAGKGVFVEIESAYEEAPDRERRLRRKQFYLRSGMEQLNVMANVFGVKMELLGWNCRMDFADYHAFYRDNYSPWAAEHIKEEIHPETSK